MLASNNVLQYQHNTTELITCKPITVTLICIDKLINCYCKPRVPTIMLLLQHQMFASLNLPFVDVYSLYTAGSGVFVTLLVFSSL